MNMTNTEDDTFRLLKRAPFNEVLEEYSATNLINGKDQLDGILAKHHWTLNEYRIAIKNYYYRNDMCHDKYGR